MRKQASYTDNENARREAAQAAYHAEEAALTADLVAATHRTLELLRAQGEYHEIQVWARRPWFPGNSHLVHGWPIRDPVYGTGFGSIQRVMLDTGEILTVQLGTRRSNADPAMSIESWIASEVRRARVEIKPDRPYAETRTNYYDLAFMSYSHQRNVEHMRRQLASMRGRVMTVLGEMLSAAGIEV